MRVRFLAVAREEFFKAVSYYDSHKEGLGDEFANRSGEQSPELSTILALGSHSQKGPGAVLLRDFRTELYIKRGQPQY